VRRLPSPRPSFRLERVGARRALCLDHQTLKTGPRIIANRLAAHLALQRLLAAAFGSCAQCEARVRDGLQRLSAPADGAICDLCGASLCPQHVHRELLTTCEPACLG
jgi:hypothetical protein